MRRGAADDEVCIGPIGVVEFDAIACIADDEDQGLDSAEIGIDRNGRLAEFEGTRCPERAGVGHDLERDGRFGTAGGIIDADVSFKALRAASEVEPEDTGSVCSNAALKSLTADGQGLFAHGAVELRPAPPLTHLG